MRQQPGSQLIRPSKQVDTGSKGEMTVSADSRVLCLATTVAAAREDGGRVQPAQRRESHQVAAGLAAQWLGRCVDVEVRQAGRQARQRMAIDGVAAADVQALQRGAQRGQRLNACKG